MGNFNKIKTNSYCVGGRHYSCTNKIIGVVTSKGTKRLKGNFTKCRRNKSMTVSDAAIEAEGLKDFFKSVGKATVNFGKKVADNPVRALEIASTIGSAAARRNPRAALSATSDLIKFATTGEGLKVVQKGRVYGLLNLSLNCLLKIYFCENFIILFLISVIIVFDNESQIVAVAKAVGIE